MLNNCYQFFKKYARLLKNLNNSPLKQKCKTIVIRSKKKKKKISLFQFKSSYRNKTGTNHHGLLSTSI